MSQFTSDPSSCGSNCSSPAPLLYNQPTSSSDFPGATTPHAPHTSHQVRLNQHSEVGLATGSTSSAHPQASNSSLGRKPIAEDLDDRDTKRIKMESDGISPSPEIDTPSDACESHCGDNCGQLAAEGAQPSCAAACQGSVSSASSASATVVGASTVPLTSSVTTTSTIAPGSSDTTLTETTEETTNSDSWTDDEVQDPAIVSSQPQLREFLLAGARREFNIWRWIDEVEDSQDPVVPIFEPVSSVLPETVLTEAAEDTDVWQLISEIEKFMDPGLPPCESLTDAAEDPYFCNYPIRTLLIGSWLNSSRWDALDQPL
ncbi:hypothetical protein EDD22DRAFT_562952 [Suillus occidentalis]|nr:hypothetical protein EDD22DRAFT_562952 [Suillus occidentalis]